MFEHESAASFGARIGHPGDEKSTKAFRSAFGQRWVSVRSALGQRKIQSGISRPFQLQIERFLMHLKCVGKWEGPTFSLQYLLIDFMRILLLPVDRVGVGGGVPGVGLLSSSVPMTQPLRSLKLNILYGVGCYKTTSKVPLCVCMFMTSITCMFVLTLDFFFGILLTYAPLPQRTHPLLQCSHL